MIVAAVSIFVLGYLMGRSGERKRIARFIERLKR